jgi:hypothetical protein
VAVLATVRRDRRNPGKGQPSVPERIGISSGKGQASVPEVVELEGDAEILLLAGGDDGLEVIALLAVTRSCSPCVCELTPFRPRSLMNLFSFLA